MHESSSDFQKKAIMPICPPMFPICFPVSYMLPGADFWEAIDCKIWFKYLILLATPARGADLLSCGGF